jgi:hypothetical protein
MTQQIRATPKRVDIPTDEYTRHRHVAEYCRWINEKLEAIKAGGQFDEQYFERIGRNVKKLIEEAIPISRLGLFLWTPGSDVYITCYADNRDCDAEVEIKGFDVRSFKVEVTTTETEESTLRRQALSREGTVPLVGRIRKQKRTIIPEYEMIDVDEQSEKYVSLTMERLLSRVPAVYFCYMGDYSVDAVYSTLRRGRVV